MASRSSTLSGDEPGAQVAEILIVAGPGDVRALQRQMRGILDGVRAALQRCAARGVFTPEKTPEDWAAWQAAKLRTYAYLNEPASLALTISQYERGEQLASALADWRAKAEAFGDTGPPTAQQVRGVGELGELGPLLLLFLLTEFGKKGR